MSTTRNKRKTKYFYAEKQPDRENDKVPDSLLPPTKIKKRRQVEFYVTNKETGKKERVLSSLQKKKLIKKNIKSKVINGHVFENVRVEEDNRTVYFNKKLTCTELKEHDLYFTLYNMYKKSYLMKTWCEKPQNPRAPYVILHEPCSKPDQILDTLIFIFKTHNNTFKNTLRDTDKLTYRELFLKQVKIYKQSDAADAAFVTFDPLSQPLLGLFQHLTQENINALFASLFIGVVNDQFEEYNIDNQYSKIRMEKIGSFVYLKDYIDFYNFFSDLEVFPEDCAQLPELPEHDAALYRTSRHEKQTTSSFSMIPSSPLSDEEPDISIIHPNVTGRTMFKIAKGLAFESVTLEENGTIAHFNLKSTCELNSLQIYNFLYRTHKRNHAMQAWCLLPNTTLNVSLMLQKPCENSNQVLDTLVFIANITAYIPEQHSSKNSPRKEFLKRVKIYKHPDSSAAALIRFDSLSRSYLSSFQYLSEAIMNELFVSFFIGIVNDLLEKKNIDPNTIPMEKMGTFVYLENYAEFYKCFSSFKIFPDECAKLCALPKRYADLYQASQQDTEQPSPSLSPLPHGLPAMTFYGHPYHQTIVDASLEAASRKSYQSIVNKLLQRHFLPLPQDTHNGFSLALYAAQHGQDDLLEELLKIGGINLSQATSEGMTIAHMAAQYGYVNVIRMLHTYQVDLTQSNQFGIPPLFIAFCYDQSSIIQYFEKYVKYPEGSELNSFDLLDLALEYSFPRHTLERLCSTLAKICGLDIDIYSKSTGFNFIN